MSGKIFVWRADFKIRTKADAEKFCNMSDDADFCMYDGELYWTDGERDYRFDADERRIYMRWSSERGNLFLPYIECRNYPYRGATAVDVIFFYRKYINKQLLNW